MAKYLMQQFDPATFDVLADFICGDDRSKYPEYRSSSYLTKFFQDISINAKHDGTTRKWWVVDVLKELSLNDLEKVILRLVDIREYKADREKLKLGVIAMNNTLVMEGLKIGFTGKDPEIVSLGVDFNPVGEYKDAVSEEAFLRMSFEDSDVSKLNLDTNIEVVIRGRLEEIDRCLKNKLPLACIFLCGSTLEGLFLGVAIQFPAIFNKAISAPKDKSDKVKPFQDWSLTNFIDVSHEVGCIQIDMKKFSHALRDFRNYIHPYEQKLANFSPENRTAQICAQVLSYVISDLTIFVSSKKI